MMYKFISRYDVNQKSHGFTLNEFEVNGDIDITQLLEANVFDNEIQPEKVKNSLDDKYGYLQGLFKPDALTADDFKFIKADSIYYYLEGFSDCEEEWGNDKPLFKKLLKKFKTISKGNLGGSYLINKEWFSEESDKVRSREFILYDYYFIIIWADKNDKSKLYISEWFSD